LRLLTQSWRRRLVWMFRTIGLASALVAPVAVVGTVLLNVVQPHGAVVIAFVFVLGVLGAVVGVAVDLRSGRAANQS